MQPPVLASFQNAFRIPFPSLRRSALSFNHAGLNLKPGIDLLTRVRGYAPRCLMPPAAHLAALVKSGRVGAGLVLTQTIRNGFQNPRSPLYSREFGICQNAAEDVCKSQRPYYGIAHLSNGRVQGVALNFSEPVPPGILYWSAGIPVLWDGRILSVEEMISEVGDFSHLWRLEVSPQRGANPDHVARYKDLLTVFRRHLHSPRDEASRALIASSQGLERQEHYLHNLMGAGPDGVVLVLANGPLEYLGHLAQRVGATHAVVVDNGGSCQLGVKRPDQRFRALVESCSFREPAIALAAFELEDSDAGPVPFAGGRLTDLSAEPSSADLFRQRARHEIEYASYNFGGFFTVSGSLTSNEARYFKVNGSGRVKLDAREFSLLAILAWHAFKVARIVAPDLIGEGKCWPIEAFIAVEDILTHFDLLRKRHAAFSIWTNAEPGTVYGVVKSLRKKLMKANTHEQLIQRGTAGGYRLSMPTQHLQLVLDGAYYGRRDLY